jgi:transcription-repair coupling factor (superfamily II helicase)
LDLNNLENVIVLDTELNNLKSFSFSTGYKEEKKVVICDDNISRIFIKKRIKRNLSQEMDLLMQIKPGDFVVHIDH